MKIVENVKRIKGKIPKGVMIVAAVKYANLEQIKELVKSGIEDLGFNTYQQFAEIKDSGLKARFHFIGHLQKNKVKKVLSKGIELIHSVDSYELAKKISNIAGQLNINQNILLQIKTDENKEFGIALNELENIINKIRKLPNITIKGIMTVEPIEIQKAEKAFELMSKTKKRLNEIGWDMKFLSMGMSNDYEIAINYGANIIRIGRALFN